MIEDSIYNRLAHATLNGAMVIRALTGLSDRATDEVAVHDFNARIRERVKLIEKAFEAERAREVSP